MEKLHAKHLLHRDVKPDNFLMGLARKSTTVFAIDFGLAKRYIKGETGEHIAFNKELRMVGTPRYCSVNAQRGWELSRRDDLEGLGFCLIYMLKGKLPWQGIRERTKESRDEKMVKLKSDLAGNGLLKGLPNELVQYVTCCRSLKFEETPPYSALHKLLNSVFQKNSRFMNFSYDWTLMGLKFKRKNAEGSDGSGKTEFEDVTKGPKRSISRLLIIKNLLAGPSGLSKVPPPEENKGVRGDRTKFLTMKSSGLLPVRLPQARRERSSSQNNVHERIGKNLQEFVNANPELRRERKANDLSNFLPAEISEQINGIA